MSFKKALKRFIGIKDPEELKVEKTTRQKVVEFFESLFYALLAALFIITFFFQNTRIPTGSMEGTILVGDFVIVNKFIYGASSPRYIPFTEIKLPYFTLPALKEPKRYDIVVFEYPGDRDDLVPKELNVQYVKRCYGLPGDTIEIRDKVIYVNGKQAWIPPFIQYLMPVPVPKEQADPQIFPLGFQWNRDNYGPLYIPRKGDKIKLTPENAPGWKTIIDREFGERVLSVIGDKVTIKGVEVTEYEFKKDYYFMIGDNRDDSADSRFWGLVPRDLIVGEALIVIWSWDREIPLTSPFKLVGSSRLERALKLLH